MRSVRTWGVALIMAALLGTFSTAARQDAAQQIQIEPSTPRTDARATATYLVRMA